MLTVGNFAILCACGPRTLRYYDRVGLLKPAMVDEWTGYRYYEESQLSDYQRIRDLQGAGFTIGEIRALLHAPAEDVRAALRRKRDELTEKQRRLAELQNSGFPAEDMEMEKNVEKTRTALLACCDEISAKDLEEAGLEPLLGSAVDTDDAVAHNQFVKDDLLLVGIEQLTFQAVDLHVLEDHAAKFGITLWFLLTFNGKGLGEVGMDVLGELHHRSRNG